VVSSKRRSPRAALLVTLVATAYFAAGGLGLALATTHGSVTLVWPATGIALAALILGGVRLWPAVLIGALGVNLAFGAASPGAAALIAVGNTLEAVVAALALGRVRGWSSGLERPSDLVAFVGFGAVLAPVVAAAVGVGALVLAQDAPASATLPLFAQWWVGDACGALMVAPLILAWAHVGSRPRPTRGGLVASLALGVAMVGLSVLAWGSGGLELVDPPVPVFIAFPFVVWFGLRYGQIGATTAVTVTAAVAIWGTVTSVAPADTLTVRLVELWLFLGVIGFSGMLAGIGAERHRVAAALADSENRYRTLVASAPNCIEELGLDGEILAMNATGLAMIGRPLEELIGTNLLDLIPEPSSRDLFARQLAAAAGGRQTRFELTAVSGAGDERSFVITLVPLRDRDGAVARVISHVYETTDTRRAERAAAALREQLLQAHKLESLGRLAGGIAHDFNNLIAVVLGHADLIGEDLAADDAATRSIEAIQLASERAAELCTQMLAYAGRAHVAPSVLDVADEVRGISELLRITLPRSATLSLDLDPRAIRVEADASQLRQVLLNLIKNAGDALGDTGREIRVRSGMTRCDADDIAGWPLAFRDAAPGRFAWVEIEDDGAGMDADTRARLFDPFFTTKPLGRGLGLATTQGILRAHGGGVEVESAPGQGARFRVLLPLCERPARSPHRRPLNAEHPRGGTILVVDDERVVRDMAASVLERAGYQVLTARDGLDALSRLGEGADIDAVLLDVSMPRLDGHQTLERLRELRPDLPVILTSGHAAPPRGDGAPQVPFLRKPFRRTELLGLLATTLRPPKTAAWTAAPAVSRPSLRPPAP